MMVKVDGVLYKVVAWASKTYPGDGVMKTSEIHPVVIVEEKKSKRPLIFKVDVIEEVNV